MSHNTLRIPEAQLSAPAAPSQERLTPTVAETPESFSSVDAMTMLLTVESLVFAVLSVALALIFNLQLAVNAERGARALTRASAGLVTLLALGALVAWGQRFLGEWPSGFGELFPVICIAIGIVAQPVLSWWIAWLNLRRAGGGQS